MPSLGHFRNHLNQINNLRHRALRKNSAVYGSWIWNGLKLLFWNRDVMVPGFRRLYSLWPSLFWDLARCGSVVTDVSGEQVGRIFNPLTPNGPYSRRTTPLTSKRCILYIYSTNIGTAYFKRGIYSQFFFSSKCSLFHNSNIFGSCIIYILYTGCAKIKKK
jgi:hypothetical protein